MPTEEVIETNIRQTIARMKRQGTVGASVACLKQNTPTNGLTCSVSEYNEKFPIVAAKVAKQRKFNLY